jgi:integration host factor subunit alpha
MRKLELRQAVFDALNGRASQKEAADLVEAVFREMKLALVHGEKLRITRFGAFTVVAKKARPGRNPRTGKQLTIKARRVVRFKASEMLKKAMNEAGAG